MRKAGIIHWFISSLIIGSLVIVSCKSSKKKDWENLNKLEKEITNSMNTKPDENKLLTYIEATKKYADDYPSDSASPAYLFKAGRLAMNIQEADKADQTIVLFDKLLNKYPNSKEAPLALFMKAFYLENNMKNLKLAEETYREFLRKYPKHILAPDAQKSIEYMGKPLETIIKEFKEKEKANK